MGNWTLVLQGTGIHHNKRKDDINWQAQQFVKLLKQEGQQVESATLTFGGREDVITTDYVYLRDEF